MDVRLLDKKSVAEILALTSVQEGMLFEYLQAPKSERYFEQLCLQLTGMLQEELFLCAWEHVVSTNEMLRSTFRWERMKKPVQIILKEVQLKLIVRDIAYLSEQESLIELENYKRMDREDVFDLQSVPFRITLIKMGENRLAVLLSYHHILFDGWSLGLILRDFFLNYHLLVAGRDILKNTRVRFKEYLKLMQTQDQSNGEAYWQTYLKDYEPMNVSLRRDFVTESSHGETYSFRLPDNLAQTAETFVKTNHLTLPTLFFVLWGILLQKYMNTNDIAYGIAVSGRNVELTGIEEMVGLFIKTLPIRITTQRETKFLDLLKETAQVLKDHEKYQYVPLTRIKRFCGLTTGNLFNVVIGFENYPLDKVFLESGTDLQVIDYSFTEQPNYDLAISVTTINEIRLDFLYNVEAFSASEIAEIVRNFTKLLSDAISLEDQTIDTFELITSSERTEILYSFNQPLPDWSELHLDKSNGQVTDSEKKECERLMTEERGKSEQTLMDLFTHSVQINPTKVAVTYNGESLTYYELNLYANQLARILCKKGVKPETVVGILVERSLQTIIGILAILKAGGAYLPLEPSFPEERLRFMLNDSGASILLTSAELLQRQAPYAVESIDLDACFSLTEDGTDFTTSVQSTNLAYIIYTSGSTGVPKGVMIEHRNVVSLFANLRLFPLSADDVWTLFHSYAFDFSVWEMFGALLSGGKLVIVPEEYLLDAQKYYSFICQECVTVINHTPTVFYNLIAEDEKTQENCLKVQSVFLGGEALIFGRLQVFKEKYSAVRLFNLYGATENTVFTSYKEIECADVRMNISNIGRPISTMQIYVLDRQQNLLPVGIPGELCISGRGLARGYLHRPEITKERFVENPFLLGERMYRTGDLVRWLRNGDLEFLTRMDQQVKLRGYRIETGEIEYQLLQHPLIREVAVSVKDADKSNAYLAAYFVAEEDLDLAALRSYLQQVLPDYMVPATFIKLETLPVTSNGKLDRKILVALSSEERDDGMHIMPRNGSEESLATIWQEVLELVDTPGVFVSFFELGGHSLNAIQVISRIEREFGVKVTIQQFFQTPTIAELAEYLRDAEKSTYESIEPVEKQSTYPLSFNQERLWTVHQIEPDSLAYNISGKITLYHSVDEKALQKALQVIVARHASFRTWFTLTEHGPVQIVEDTLELPVKIVDLTEMPLGVDNREQVYQAEVSTCFDLEKLPLIKVTVLKISEQEWDLIFSMHHIISDGWSVEILKREFNSLYMYYYSESCASSLALDVNERAILEPLPIQYIDFASWQKKQYGQPDSTNPSYHYWKERLEEGFSTLNLPYDYSFAEKSKANAGYRFAVNAEITKSVKQFAQQFNLTLFTVMYSVFNLMLAKFSGQKEIASGIPSAGREKREVQNLIGFFVNTVFLKIKIDSHESFLDFCQRVNKECLTALEHQNYPLEPILSELKLRYPEVSVFFNMLNLTNGALLGQVESFSSYHFKTVQDAKFDLIMYVSEYENGIEVQCNYRSSLFKPATIEYMFTEYVKILSHFVQYPDHNFEAFRKRNKQKIF